MDLDALEIWIRDDHGAVGVSFRDKLRESSRRIVLLALDKEAIAEHTTGCRPEESRTSPSGQRRIAGCIGGDEDLVPVGQSRGEWLYHLPWLFGAKIDRPLLRLSVDRALEFDLPEPGQRFCCCDVRD